MDAEAWKQKRRKWHWNPPLPQPCFRDTSPNKPSKQQRNPRPLSYRVPIPRCRQSLVLCHFSFVIRPRFRPGRSRASPQLSFTFIDKQNKFSLSFWSIFWNGISRLKLKKQNKGNWGWKKKKLRSGFKLFFVLSQMKVFSFTEQFRDEFERKTLFSHF